MQISRKCTEQFGICDKASTYVIFHIYNEILRIFPVEKKGVQGTNQEFEGKIEEGNKEEQEAKGARSYSDISQSLFSLA